MDNSSKDLQQLSTQTWDVIVVGGGITGAGVAREAARLNLKVLLLEQQDFAWGTSSRSSKMVHGGLRYLAQGDIGLTKHSLQERERLLTEAPGLIERLGYFFLLKKSLVPMKWGLKLILSLYDFLAGIKDHSIVSKKLLKQAVPALDVDTLTGAGYFSDAITDDARLVLRVLQEAEHDGATLLNYCQVKASHLEEDALNTLNVISTAAESAEQQFQLKAKVIVNSTGAWADTLRMQRNPEQRVRPLKGSHLILAKGVLPTSKVISFAHQEDKRNMFAYPWLGHTVIGTTDIDNDAPINQESAINQQEVDYLLAAANQYFSSTPVTIDDVISTWSGVRPVIASDKNYQQQQGAERKKPSKERRDHAIWDDKGLITVSGGKLTTFRLMALDVLEKAQQYLGKLALEDKPVFTKPDEHNSQADSMGRYGFRFTEFDDSRLEIESVHLEDTPYSLADCRWSLKNEWVHHLDDLMLRRTRLGLLLPQGGENVLARLKPLFQEELAWDENKWQHEQQRYLQIWQSYYSVPEC